MTRVSALAGFAILAVALLVGTGTSQEKKDKIKGQLPPGWKKLDLSKEQVIKIYSIQTQFREKIKQLEQELAKIKTQERSEMIQVLSEDQKEALRKITLGEETKKKAPPKDK
jgi:Spy/CpxP family protein refolding chaperone